MFVLFVCWFVYKLWFYFFDIVIEEIFWFYRLNWFGFNNKCFCLKLLFFLIIIWKIVIGMLGIGLFVFILNNMNIFWFCFLYCVLFWSVFIINLVIYLIFVGVCIGVCNWNFCLVFFLCEFFGMYFVGFGKYFCSGSCYCYKLLKV